MKKRILISYLICITAYGLYAQQSAMNAKFNWKTDPFDLKVFVANAGQCNGAIPGNMPILYHVQFGEIDAYFTANGITYRYDEYPKLPAGLSPEDAEEQGYDTIKPVTHYLSMNWAGSSSNAVINTLQPQTYYYTYTIGKSTNVRAKIYKEIIYRNLYPGIDVDYTFPAGFGISSGSIKYALIVHPGANLSNVKLNYTGADNLKVDAQGDIIISSVMGTCTDHKPVSYYQEDMSNKATARTIGTSFNLSDNTESFSINDKYDHTKTLVIDPVITWSSDPVFTGAHDNALDLDYDYSGNVYAYGGTWKYQLVMFNSSGVEQWVWNCRMPKVAGLIETIGNLAVNRYLGVSYVSAGFGDSIWKISPTGALQGSYKDPSGGGGTGTEDWKLLFNPGSSPPTIIGGTGGRQQELVLDTNTPPAVVTESTGGNANACCHDIVTMALDPSWNKVYMINGNNGADEGKDSLFSVPLNTLSPFNWVKYPTFTAFGELSNGQYYSSVETTSANPLNGMAASRNAIYVYNGADLWRASLTNGALAQTLAVSAKLYRWSGLSVDHCDDVYAGVGPAINIYNGLSLTLNSTINMAVTTDTVYDVKLGEDSNTTLYACGMGFVASIQLTGALCPTVPLPITLLYFNCAPESGGIELSWATATETNNKYFTIERSGDGVNFYPITTIPGAGNSVFTKYYTYEDAKPLDGTNYYRLSQTDYYGNTQQDNISACSEEEQNNNILKVYPNPSAGTFSVELPYEAAQTSSTLVLYDLLGRAVYDQTEQNQQTVNINVPNLSAGLYILSVTTTQKTYVTKLLITN